MKVYLVKHKNGSYITIDDDGEPKQTKLRSDAIHFARRTDAHKFQLFYGRGIWEPDKALSVKEAQA